MQDSLDRVFKSRKPEKKQERKRKNATRSPGPDLEAPPFYRPERYKSDIAYFHDQKQGDFDPESGVIYDPNHPNFMRYHNALEEQQIDREIGDKSMVEKHLNNVITQIDSIAIDESHKDDSPQEQKQLLKQKKETAKKLISEVLFKVEDYVRSIRTNDEIKQQRNEMDAAEYRKENELSDRMRRIKHDALISQINIANRFISRNFADIDREMIWEWEDQETAAGRKVLYAKRVKFPPNIICTDTVNMNDRKQIMEWAVQLARSVSEIKNDILKGPSI